MPDKTTDEKLVEALGAVANLGNALNGVSHNLGELKKAVTALTERLDTLIERLEKQA